MIRPLLTFVPFLFPLLGMCVTYYVSPTGNDQNNGTSQANAWRTLERAQQVTQSMQPGDRILFQRGGVYPGMLSLNASGTAADPMVFGAYGTGDDPVISGGHPVINWVQYQGNIWRAALTDVPKYVIVNHQPLTLARFPNSGWLRNANGSNTHLSNNAQITQPNGQWNGATVVIRTTNWSYEKATINSHSNGTLNITPISLNPGTHDWGFFIQNSLAALDAPGEWYHDASSGQLYVWLPGNANPNNAMVLASTVHHGFAPGWQRQHIRIENITFQGQTAAGISTEVAHHVVVTGCTFRYLYKAVSSSGSNNLYINNTIHDTYATGISIYGEPGTVVAENTLTDIAVVPGQGEDGWGYFGIVISGPDHVVRDNRLDNIGYLGIATSQNGLIERNVVRHATSILNDGAAITFDNADGVIVRDNIIVDMICDLESVATEHYAYYKIGFGIYFGNTYIVNTLVEGNTVTRCAGAGIHVDHTMLSAGNQIKNNILFDNDVQLSLSDYSNNNGPGSTPPYHVPAYNTVYEGNVMYSVRPEQLCMRHFNVYSANLVDFGSFNNNRYFHPYNELSIMVRVFPTGEHKYYTLERWQTERGEDLGSTRSPLRLTPYEVTQVLGAEQINNGHFTQNVNGWTGWPTQAQVTQDHSMLDNGAMKVHFADNSNYDVFFLHQQNMATLQDEEFYRLRMSLQSNMHGILRAEVKGESQMTGPYAMFDKQLPFDGERRDLTIFFQSDRSEPARIQFINHYTESTYWIDNISLERVAVEYVDPYERHILLYNDNSTVSSFALDGCWSDVSGGFHSGTISLQAFSSIVLQKEEDSICGISTMVDDLVLDPGSPGVYPNPVKAGGELRFTTPLEGVTDALLVDAAGRAVQMTKLLPDGQGLMLDGDLSGGLYHLVLRTPGSTRNHRVVVER